MATYVGLRTEERHCEVWVIDSPVCQRLDLRLDLRRHSPAGFEWGYCGSGPAQLALALMCHLTGDDEVARLLYQWCKLEIIAGLPKQGWVLTDSFLQNWMIERIGRAPKPIPDKIDLGKEGLS